MRFRQPDRSHSNDQNDPISPQPRLVSPLLRRPLVILIFGKPQERRSILANVAGTTTTITASNAPVDITEILDSTGSGVL